MASPGQCPKCGAVLAETGAATCPACGANVAAARTTPFAAAKIGIALFQIAAMATFGLVFKFQKIMIAMCGGFILIGTLFSSRLKPRQPSPAIAQKPLLHPVLFRVTSVAVALCSLVLFCIVLFGFVIFMNAWSGWQRYEGQRFHRTDFQVRQVYYQKHKGTPDMYASGTVEGDREWMTVRPYLHPAPQSEAELYERVPRGTSIPIYLFPDLKGRSRVRVVGEEPTAEDYHRNAMDALKYSLAGLALTAGILFVLVRLRRLCFDKTEPPLATTNPIRVG